METTIACGKHFANHCKLTGSRFEDVCLGEAAFDDVNLSGATFENINLTGARFHNVNLNNAVISAANLGGVTFRHLGPAPDKNGAHPPQAPVTFREADLNGSKFEDVNLSNVEIKDCNIDGLSIDGVVVADLIRAHLNRED